MVAVQVHDVQFDYYGRRLATCSSDRSIKVFNAAGEQAVPEAELLGHDGPVWQVAWAHPRFGNILASCSFDNSIIVWKEMQSGVWSQFAKAAAPWCTAGVLMLSRLSNDPDQPIAGAVYSSQAHTASVNGISFAPHELGLILASASSDGSIAILTYQTDGNWAVEKVRSGHCVLAMLADQ
ncbi:GTPase-activating protein S13 [Pseudocyphellaria aurata]|nr:GTPase-activating protein S13 [Pseudocyphellaria aurata]